MNKVTIKVLMNSEKAYNINFAFSLNLFQHCASLSSPSILRNFRQSGQILSYSLLISLPTSKLSLFGAIIPLRDDVSITKMIHNNYYSSIIIY